MTNRFGRLVCVSAVGIMALSGCSSHPDVENSGSSAVATIEDSKQPGSTRYSYVISNVVASVDGISVTLRAFNFSAPAHLSNASLVQIGTACRRISEGLPRGAIAVATRGECSFEEKMASAHRSGASALVITAQGTPPTQADKWSVNPRISLTPIPILATTSESTIERLNSGRSASIEFSAHVATT